MTQGGNAGCSQVVGVNVIGIAVIHCTERRQGLGQALDGQAISRVDARGAQDGDFDAGPLAPLTQAMFGIDATAGAGALRIQAAGFVDLRPATVAINPRRAYVDQTPW